MQPFQFRLLLISAVLIFIGNVDVVAQLPFYTDDSDTTPKGKFHLEIYNEHDWLQKSSFPGQRQNTSVFTLNYGLTDHIELGVNAPFIKIFNDRSAMVGNPSGIGDT